MAIPKKLVVEILHLGQNANEVLDHPGKSNVAARLDEQRREAMIKGELLERPLRRVSSDLVDTMRPK